MCSTCTATTYAKAADSDGFDMCNIVCTSVTGCDKCIKNTFSDNPAVICVKCTGTNVNLKATTNECIDRAAITPTPTALAATEYFDPYVTDGAG